MVAHGRTPTFPGGTVVTENTCCRCGRTKPVSEFGLHRRRASGVSNLCKQCAREGQARLSDVHDVSVSEKRCATCGKTKPASQFWRRGALKSGLMSSCIVCTRKRQAGSYGAWQRADAERHPERVLARRLVRFALESGKLVKPTLCETCGRDLRLHAHHADYDNPLEVAWLCHSCHVKLHIRLRRESVATP